MTKSKALELISATFHKGGCARIRDLQRQQEVGSQSYKKGYEIRLPVSSQEGSKLIIEALIKLGFRPGRPYAKARQIIIPIYGKAQVAKFAKTLSK